jgi:death-on-curing protein
VIDFLSVDDVLLLHRDQIDRYGGEASLRDRGLLESALAQPAAVFGGEYLHGDLYEMAAAYLYHLVQNHPFVDGNKRIGAVTGLAFLRLNGVVVRAPAGELADLTLSVATGRAQKPEIAAWFRGRSSPSP